MTGACVCDWPIVTAVYVTAVCVTGPIVTAVCDDWCLCVVGGNAHKCLVAISVILFSQCTLYFILLSADRIHVWERRVLCRYGYQGNVHIWLPWERMYNRCGNQGNFHLGL